MDRWARSHFHCGWSFNWYHCSLLNAYLGIVNMIKKLKTVNTSGIEFLYKFAIVLFIIMPVCMGGFFWIGLQFDNMLNIHLFKFVFPFLGTLVGVFFTALLIMAGHSKQQNET